MSILEIPFISVCLAADSFAVSLCKGLSLKKYSVKTSLVCGLWFGFFQFIMPIIGFAIGNTFVGFIKSIDHYIVFIILTYIGINMIKNKNDDEIDKSLNPKNMFVLAIATSIDALAVGFSLSLLKAKVFLSSIIIGVVAFIFSFIGVIIGNLFGSEFKKYASKIGGSILILIGLKILLEHFIK